MAKGKVFTNARGRLLINGAKVGYARGCSGGESIEYEAVEVMDNIQVEEHVPTRYRVRFSASLVRLVGETAKTLGHFPKLGTNPQAHLRNILTSGDLNVAVEDNQTGALICTVVGAKAATNDFNFDGGVAVRNMDFVALSLKDESEV